MPFATSLYLKRQDQKLENKKRKYYQKSYIHYYRRPRTFGPTRTQRRMQFVDVILWVYSTGLTLFIFPEYMAFTVSQVLTGQYLNFKN